MILLIFLSHHQKDGLTGNVPISLIGILIIA